MKTFGNIFNFKKAEKGSETIVAESLYQCPMKCEGDKLYDAPGNCPACNMKLVLVNPHGSKSHEHGHDHHSRHAYC